MLATGGTIASRVSPGGGLTPALTGQALLDFVPALAQVCRITVRDVCALDSTDLTTADRVRLARAIWQARAQFDGFVVTHGTDTLAYTAALLAHALPDFDKPVLLTGSMHPIGVPDSDAPDNLLGAFRVAASGAYAGVAACVHGMILRGSRVVKTDSAALAAFSSIGAPPDGSVDADGTVHVAQQPPRTRAPRLTEPRGTRVFVLRLTPDTDAAALALLHGFDSVILESFGAGGIPAGLEGALGSRLAAGTRVYITTQCPFGGADLTKYAVGCRARALGAIDLCARTIEDSLAAIACGDL